MTNVIVPIGKAAGSAADQVFRGGWGGMIANIAGAALTGLTTLPVGDVGGDAEHTSNPNQANWEQHSAKRGQKLNREAKAAERQAGRLEKAPGCCRLCEIRGAEEGEPACY